MRGSEPVCDCVQPFLARGKIFSNLREIAGWYIAIKERDQVDAAAARDVSLLDFVAGVIRYVPNSVFYESGRVIEALNFVIEAAACSIGAFRTRGIWCKAGVFCMKSPAETSAPNYQPKGLAREIVETFSRLVSPRYAIAVWLYARRWFRVAPPQRDREDHPAGNNSAL